MAALRLQKLDPELPVNVRAVVCPTFDRFTDSLFPSLFRCITIGSMDLYSLVLILAFDEMEYIDGNNARRTIPKMVHTTTIAFFPPSPSPPPGKVEACTLIEKSSQGLIYTPADMVRVETNNKDSSEHIKN
jgi:hypothetical protein